MEVEDRERQEGTCLITQPYLEKAEHDRKRYEVELGDYEEKKKTHKTVIEISEKESDSEEEDEENSE